tara:strand:+ start:566 stop:832 length:267 start_codon:yes stop_codon:yes gene_type:complete
MSKRKSVRTRGKLQLSRYFQEFAEGDNVAVVKENSIQSKVPERIQGKTGLVEGKRGRAYVIKINDQKKEKRFVIAPIHLKKIKQTKKE